MRKKSILTSQDSNTRFSRSVSNYENILTFQTSSSMCVCVQCARSVERSVTFVNNCQYFDVSDWFSLCVTFLSCISFPLVVSVQVFFGVCYHGAWNCTMYVVVAIHFVCVLNVSRWFLFSFFSFLLLCRRTTKTEYDPP